ncbi:MAG: TetR/AcrR family transcriptional regulator [Myxococcales bacterium]|nr:TetR/AcrR family transcriptional regulator [Myxococcales bacterium]
MMNAPRKPKNVAEVERSSRLWAKDRRQQLIDVSAGLIVREGADRVRIPEVAAAAGVTRPVVYKFFPNRQALLIAVLEDFTDALRDGLRARLVATPPAGPDRNADDFRETVRAFVEVVFDVIDEKGAGGWYLFGTVSAFPELEQTVDEVRARMVRPWHRTISEVTGNTPATVNVVAQMLVAISRATVQQWIDGRIDRAGALDALMRGTTAIISEFTVQPAS